MGRPSSTARRRPRSSASRASRRLRLLPLGGLLLVLVVILVVIVSGSGGGSSPQSAAAPRVRTVLVAHPEKSLPAAISGESVVAARQGPLIIGGLGASESSASGVFQLSPGNGELSEAGSLTTPLHDTGATVLGGRVLVFGGGTETSTDTVRSLPLPGAGATAATAEVTGKLPTVRSDLSAVTVGDRAYVLGGYDGTKPIDSILATSDGSSFEEIGRLPDPARYLAVATLGGKIFAFGGENEGGAAVDAIREHQKVKPPAKVTASAQPFEGQLMIADRGNDRIIVVNAQKHILWRFPSKAHPAPPGGFYFPDDAFFIHGGKGLISNEEQNQRVVQLSYPAILVSEVTGSYIDEITQTGKLVWTVQLPIAYPSDPQQLGPDRYLVADYTKPGGIYEFNRAGKIVWQYGTTGEPGTSSDHLHIPDGFDLLAPDGTTPTHPFTG